MKNTESTLTSLPANPVSKVDQALAKNFGAVPQVKYVLVEKVSNSLLVWIAIDTPTPAVRRRIYDKELGLITEFRDVAFDFNLIPALGRSPQEIATGVEVIFSRPE